MKLLFQSSLLCKQYHSAILKCHSAVLSSFQEQDGLWKTRGYVTGLVQDPSPLSTTFWHHFSFLEEAAANSVTTLSQITWLVLRTKFDTHGATCRGLCPVLGSTTVREMLATGANSAIKMHVGREQME